MYDQPLNVMVLAGGPDREREVSLLSGEQVVAALRDVGHHVRQRDITPQDLTALDEFASWPGDVIFPALHGSWGEGGGLQQILGQKKLPYFGCDAFSADLCMDKDRTKQRLRDHGLPTPGFEVIEHNGTALPSPVVLKPLREGSSFDVRICRTGPEAQRALDDLSKRYPRLLVEQFIVGLELTVGVIGGPHGDEPLPPVQIIPATDFYDYEAKYLRDDTQYLFDIPLPTETLQRIRKQALQAHRLLGCRHLSRVDFIVDQDGQSWILEVNTIPGFTAHSLVPKAAAHAGISWPILVDRLARLAVC